MSGCSPCQSDSLIKRGTIVLVATVITDLTNKLFDVLTTGCTYDDIKEIADELLAMLYKPFSLEAFVKALKDAADLSGLSPSLNSEK